MRWHFLQVSAICLFSVALASGFEDRKPTIFRIAVECPAATTGIDEVVATRLLEAINGLPNLTNIEALSYHGRTDIFVSVLRNDSMDLVVQRVQDQFPVLFPGCKLLGVNQLQPGEAVPSPDRGETEYVVMGPQSDEVIAKLGVTLADFGEAAVAAADAADVEEWSPDHFEDLKERLIYVNGRLFRLDEVTIFRVVKEPMCIARDLEGRRPVPK